MTTAEKITLGFHGAEALAVTVFFAFMAWAVNSARVRINDAEAQTMSSTTATMRTIQRSMVVDNAGVQGTLAQAQTTLASLNQTILSAKFNLNSTSTQLKDTLAALQGTANAATETAQDASVTLQTANRTIAGLQPVEIALTSEIGTLQTTTLSLNTQIDSPAVRQTLQSTAGTMHNLDLMTTDAQHKFHAVLYPEPCKTKKCRMLQWWSYFKMASSMASPAYWSWQLFKGVTR